MRSCGFPQYAFRFSPFERPLAVGTGCLASSNEDEDSRRNGICPIGQVSQIGGTKVQVAHLSQWARPECNMSIINHMWGIHRAGNRAWILRSPKAGFLPSELSSVNRHTYSGVHAGLFEGVYLAHTANSACGGDGQPGDALKLPEPREVGSLHR